MCEAKSLETERGDVRHHIGEAPVLPPNNQHQRRHRSKSPNSMGFWWTSCVTVLGTAIIVAWIPNLLSPDPPKGNIDGFVIPRLKKVSDTFRLHLLSEEEKGAAFAVIKDGEIVVDLWGGYADIEAWQPWKESTVANTFSLYTMVASLSLGLLHERGLLDFDKPVTFYWPEFERHNKGKITVRNILSEESGLSRLNRSVSIADISNDEFLSEELANQVIVPPDYLWCDGDLGILELYINQLVRRVDPKSRSLKEFFVEEFAAKLDLDFYVGLPLAEQHRAARVRGHGFSVIFEVFFAPIELYYTLVSYMRPSTFTEINSIRRLNDPGIRSLSIGSVAGFASARAIAKLYNSAILVGPNNTSPSISEDTWLHMHGIPHIHKKRLLKKIGVASNWTMTAAGQMRTSPKGSKLIGYSGFGGQYAFVDQENNISMAYLTNYNSIYRSQLDPRFRSLLRALYDSI
ncbi:beta-lactamase domain-containing protein 2-like [Watersipora subatra]|uniref:beta-lactamase domain-containing protein 2-like n=1 Tax=Watersipora subatra TaxID=2589382 RepID=UPI00355C21B1